MNSIASIYPLSPVVKGEGYIHDILNALFIRTCYSARSMQKIGWQGINPICRSGRGWTFRVAGRGGVYGLSENGTFSGKRMSTAAYAIYYFPSPGEKISLFPKSMTRLQRRKDYMTMVREYTRYPDFSAHFFAGVIEVSLFTGSQALWLTMVSPESSGNIQQLVEMEYASSDGGDNPLLKNDGKEQSSLFSLSFSLFELLAATWTHNLDSLPGAAAHVLYRSGQQDEKDTLGKDQEYIRSVSVGYGSEDFESHFRNNNKCSPDASYIDYWESGYRKEKPFSGSSWWNKGGFATAITKEIISDDTSRQRPSLIILTGFLGSGKTTFLRRFIEYQVSRNRFVAVIQNEIGSAGLDGRLLEDQYAVIEMDEGCVCCSLIGELKNGIQRITAELKPDIIILETTGLANPFNLTVDLNLISDLVKLDMVVAMIDGANFTASAAKSEIVTDQVRAADMLVLNKCDMITGRQTDDLCRQLKEMNPAAGIIKCSHGDVNMSLLSRNGREKGESALIEITGDDCYRRTHHTHSDEMIHTGKIVLDAPVDKSIFLNEIAHISKSVYRIKGVVDFRGEREPSLVQVVQGSCEITAMKHHLPGERYLIVIGMKEETDILLHKLLLTKTGNYEKTFECSQCADDFGS
jgi:G3E family GTPase